MKKKIKHRKLNSSERPLFAAYNNVQLSKKDKLKKRQKQKLQLKKEVEKINDEKNI